MNSSPEMPVFVQIIIPVFVRILLPIGPLVVGGGISIWLSPIPDDKLTTAQSNMLDTADWIIKASVGALLSLGGNAIIRATNRNGAAK